jgi:prolyl oligopeptidase
MIDNNYSVICREASIDILHGIMISDQFRWLEDRDALETRTFIAGEKEIYEGYLSSKRDVGDRVLGRVKELLTVPTVEVPISDRCGGLLYLKRSGTNEQKSVCHCDRSGIETEILSPHSHNGTFFESVSILEVSPTGRFAALGIRTGGEDVQEVRMFDLHEHRLLPDRIPKGFYRGIVFDEKGDCFYYAHEDEDGRYQARRAIRKHQMGSSSASDEEVFCAGESSNIRLVLFPADDSLSLGYLVVTLDSVRQSEFFIQRLPLSHPPLRVLEFSNAVLSPKFSGDVVEVGIADTTLPGRIVRIHLNAPAPENWEEIVPAIDGEQMLFWDRWNDNVVVHHTAGARLCTRIFSASRTLSRSISYSPTGTTIVGRVDPDRGCLFYSYSDIDVPPSVYYVDLSNGEHHLWWRQPISGKDLAFWTEQRTYRSVDGTNIPLTLIHPNHVTGIRPVLLSAYGGGGLSATTKYSALLTVLVENGFTCATAHVRGGGDGGVSWHQAALRGRKQVAVDDLTSAASWLIEQGYTSAAHLGVAGQSHGAFLSLCALTQRPDLFRAVLSLGPIADLTRFHRFGVARGAIAEFGDPDQASDFGALLQLSPYHRVREGTDYPAVLIISGDKDKRCDSLHSRKMIARLRGASVGARPILLDYTEARGHKPVMPLSERIRALTNRLTFLVGELNLSSKGAGKL